MNLIPFRPEANKSKVGENTGRNKTASIYSKVRHKVVNSKSRHSRIRDSQASAYYVRPDIWADFEGQFFSK